MTPESLTSLNKFTPAKAIPRINSSKKIIFTLTLITELALPINLVAGFFGMNVGGVPLANNPHGFILLVLVVTIFTCGAAWLVLRRRERG